MNNRNNYFGARYYDADISVWLSVDPLSDKYPSMSAYMYCAGNPVMLVDPDGRKIVITNNGESFEWNPGVVYSGQNQFIINTVNSLQSYYDKGLGDVSSSVDGNRGSAVVKGNVVTDFTKGGDLYSSHVITITNGDDSNSNSMCICGPGNSGGQLINGVWHYGITWNPSTGIDIRSNSGKSLGQLSPMITLFHEFAHGWLWARVPERVKKMKKTNYQNGLGDENWILEHVERPAAKAFDQTGRSVYKEAVDENDSGRMKLYDSIKKPYDILYKTNRYDSTTHE
jgi:hypothetical protein